MTVHNDNDGAVGDMATKHAHAPAIRIGVTGTDTGVGKTVVTCAIITALQSVGLRAAGMKPIETGGSDDAQRIRAASGNAEHPLNRTGPIVLPEPLAPLIAARRAHVELDFALLDSTFRALELASDAIIVEGAGGLLVPFTANETFASLCQRWSLDLIIVAANRLGVINHTLLTVEAAQARGLNIRAIVLNSNTTERSPSVPEQTNRALLQELLEGIPVIEFPHSPTAGPELITASNTLLEVLGVAAPPETTQATQPRLEPQSQLQAHLSPTTSS